MPEEVVNKFKWVRFLIGALFFTALLYADFVLAQDVSILLYALVGALMGIEIHPSKLIGGKK